MKYENICKLVCGIVAAILGFLILAILFTSCNPTQKAVNTFNKKPGIAADYCAVKFPPKDSIVVRDSVSLDTLYVGGDFIFDTTYIERHDTIVQTITKTVPPKVVIKTVAQTKEVYRANTAKETALQNQLASCIQQNSKKDQQITDLKNDVGNWKGKAHKYWWIIVALLVFSFRTQLFNLSKKLLNMKKFIPFIICTLFLMSCGGKGQAPTDYITLGQAWAHVSHSFSYWIWIFLAVLPLPVYFIEYRKGKIDQVDLKIVFAMLVILSIAIFMRPCEVAANTTVEQAARGGWIGY